MDAIQQQHMLDLIGAIALPLALGLMLLMSLAVEAILDWLKERKYQRKYKAQRRLVINRRSA